jgi:hypothetical protein
MTKKRKKESPSQIESDTSDSEYSNCVEDEVDKYSPYRVTDYSRRYPEDSAVSHELIVFLESTNDVPLGSRDTMYLSSCFTRFVKGAKYLKKINKYKVGVVFDKPNFANAFLDNSTFLREQNLKASIPAGSTEMTGVINSVPVDMSNKKIFKAISSSKKIICVRRIMRKAKTDNTFQLVPTQTVAITFASSTCLPDHVFIKMWRFPVLPYIPPLKQCFKCLRFGHLAKFCHNSQRCSICTEAHSYKDCSSSPDKAVCVHCSGNHLSISGDCPVKKQKIQENKNKFSRTPFTELFNNKQSFPKLNKVEDSQQLIDMVLTNEKALNLLTESLIKIITLNKTENIKINSQMITNHIKETIQIKKKKLSHSQTT